MDISSIRDFDSYIPCFDTDPRQILEDILYKADYLSEKDIQGVWKAYNFALEKHTGQTRLSGEPYIVHPLRVLEFLMEMHPDLASMQAALLHDVMEDCEVSFEVMFKQFGKEVAHLCEGLVKVSKVRYKGEERQLETLKKTFLAMGKDLRVIIIKLADRVHNIQTLGYHPKREKAERIAHETLQVFVPIAKRLGLYNFQGYLENGAFKFLETKEYESILSFIENKYGVDNKAYKKIAIDALYNECEKYSIQALSIKGRLKSPYRIFVKLQKYHTNDLTKIFDILAFRIVVPSIADCYTCLGLIHGKWTPIFSKLKDYIALPKPNGYKSLHTTILGMFDFPVEIQIRTPEMDEVAEYGVAAHFAYAEANKSVKISDAQVQWIQQLQEIVESYTEGSDQEGFKESLEIELLHKDIFVYTPKGDIIQMPIGSSVLDFAFRVHSDVGLRFRSGLINGKIVPLDYRLVTGDIVSVQTYKNKYTATRGRLTALHTPSAKTKLNKYLRQMEHIEIENMVVELLNQKLHEYSLPLIDSKEDQIRKRYKGGEFEYLINRIYEKNMSPLKLIKEVYAEEFTTLNALELQQIRSNQQRNAKKKAPSDPGILILVDGDMKLELSMCPACKPTHADKIIAKSDKEGMKIHSLLCKGLQTVPYQKLYEAHWVDQEVTIYYLHLLLGIQQSQGLLIQLLKIFDFYSVPVQSIQVVGEQLEISLEFSNPSKMSYIIEDIKSKANINILKRDIS